MIYIYIISAHNNKMYATDSEHLQNLLFTLTRDINYYCDLCCCYYITIMMTLRSTDGNGMSMHRLLPYSPNRQHQDLFEPKS